MSEQVDVSVVVPLFNEEANVLPLVEEVRAALDAWCAWELVLVDDGSRDATARIVSEVSGSDPRIRLVRLARNYGQSPAMQAGFDHARGSIVVSMDGDLQNDPQDIPALITKLSEGYDLVAGYRLKRKDRLLTRRVPSWVANRLIRALTGIPIRDNGCSLKAYRGELLRQMHLYSDMHRFIPAVAAATACARVAEIPVRHHPRRFGVSKYGLSRVVKVLSDLLVIKLIRSFRDQPLLLFLLGTLVAALVGVVFAGWTAACAAGLISPSAGVCAEGLVLSSVSILWLGLASYLLMLGCIAEALRHDVVLPRSPVLPIVRELDSQGTS